MWMRKSTVAIRAWAEAPSLAENLLTTNVGRELRQRYQLLSKTLLRASFSEGLSKRRFN
jgi:hypothetical protein